MVRVVVVPVATLPGRLALHGQGGYEINNLTFKMSLTNEAEEQRHCLRRVPSIGGTSELDMTIPDGEFFGCGMGT